ncbi:unnamed protein product [Protopolystoma xenopodis]|uniref:Uncharacterized protein n=1 Tax=Protopolystoma xenopodis TaxID=117903 RepID=A0A448XK31_9PLAT|nr:unnamed protein product [Protopolystoma xenopodis]
MCKAGLVAANKEAVTAVDWKTTQALAGFRIGPAPLEATLACLSECMLEWEEKGTRLGRRDVWLSIGQFVCLP